jgi:hypothetical protein
MRHKQVSGKTVAFLNIEIIDLFGGLENHVFRKRVLSKIKKILLQQHFAPFIGLFITIKDRLSRLEILD